MTLTVLLTIITAVALFITLLNGFVLNKNRNWILSFLQSFSGVFFLISGFVKVVDPLGTAYKMEDYFHAFSKHLANTPFSFLDGLWHLLADNGVYVALVMIVLELLIGFMLLIGSRRKIVAWVFLAMVFFFAILTGFTYLTGYVPPDVTFFEFSKWGLYSADQMEVSDCGCFGDFLKLEPYTSFIKDIFLLIPAIAFILFYKYEYQWWTKSVRFLASIAFVTIVTVFGMYNTWFDIPVFDFRPFKEGTDIRGIKAMEEEAMNNVEVLGYKLYNSISGEEVELTMDEYLENFKSYPKSEWEFTQIKTEPEIEATKISDFIISGINNENLSEEMLNNEDFNLWVISPVLHPVASRIEEYEVMDTIAVYDTAQVRGEMVVDTSMEVVKRMAEREVFEWQQKYIKRYTDIVGPAIDYLKSIGKETYVVVGGAGQLAVEDLTSRFAPDAQAGTADEILLKTMIRSNPGFILAKDGVVIRKWHFNKFNLEELKQLIQ